MIEFMGKCQEVTRRQLPDGIAAYSGRLSFGGHTQDVVCAITEVEANYLTNALRKGARIRMTIEVVEP